MATFWQRVVGAAKLDIPTYEEVEHDTNATGQAMTVVILSSIAAGIGLWHRGAGSSVIGGLVIALVGWAVWAFLTYLIGTKLLPEPQTEADVPQLLRTLGFASSPGLLRFLGVIPLLGSVIMLIVSIWMLVAMIIAVRQALDYTSTWRAVAVAVIGWAVYLALFGILHVVIPRPMM
jgi:hypothetical protein